MHGSRKIFVGSMLAATVLVAGLTELYISSPPIADTEQPVIQSNAYSAEWYLSEIAQKYPEFTVLDYASPPDEQQGIVQFAAIAQGEDRSMSERSFLFLQIQMCNDFAQTIGRRMQRSVFTLVERNFEHLVYTILSNDGRNAQTQPIQPVLAIEHD